jgi:two-component system LytT family response regulator
MASYKTLIIDDEKIARNRLKRLLKDFEDSFQVIGEAKNGNEGLELIRKLKPDLIFLDIQMPGKTGFEMLLELEELPIVIFCTAFEEYALKAFDTVAVDYLVKPVEEHRLEKTVEKLHRLVENDTKSQIEELLQLVQNRPELKILNAIPYKIGDRVILVKLEKIIYFLASEKYVEFFTTDGKKYVTEISLKKLEDRLPDNFKRVHRGAIVNSDFIKEFRKYFRGKYIIILNDPKNTKIETGRFYAKEIRKLIQFK